MRQRSIAHVFFLSIATSLSHTRTRFLSHAHTHLFSAFLTLTQIVFGDEWHEIMDDCSVTAPFCTPAAFGVTLGCICICKYIHVYVYIYIHTYIYIYIHICIYLYTCVYIYIYIYIYIHLLFFIYIHIYMYIHIYTCTHMYVHVCTHICVYIRMYMQPSVTPKAAGVQKGAVTLQSSIISCHSSPKTICINVKNAENRCVCACESECVPVCVREKKRWRRKIRSNVGA